MDLPAVKYSLYRAAKLSAIHTQIGRSATINATVSSPRLKGG